MIDSETSTASYTGNNSTSTSYAIPFRYRNASDIVVIVTDSGGTETTLTEGQRTVTNVTDSEGRITSGSLTTGTAYDSTNTVLIKRVTPQLQENDFVEGSRIGPEALETALDVFVMMIQENKRDAAS